MITDISNAISVALNTEFGNSYEIYTEKVNQDFEEPCFFVQFISFNDSPLLRLRRKRNYLFDVVFFPQVGHEEIMAVAERIKDVLEYITLSNGDKLKSYRANSEIVDDVLHTTITFPVMLNDLTQGDMMENLTESVGSEG